MYLNVKFLKKCYQEIQENIDIILVSLSKQILEAVKIDTFHYITFRASYNKWRYNRVNGKVTNWKKTVVPIPDGS